MLIKALKHINEHVAEISLDHDLGDDKVHGTGYDVVKFLEEQVHTNPKFVCPVLTIHTQNPVGRQNIQHGIDAITRYILNNKGTPQS